MDANTGQICAALMTHQDVGDGEVLADLLDQIPADTPIDTIGGDGAYDSKPCHAEIAARGAQHSIPPRDGAKPWSESTPGAAWRNEAIDVIEKSSRGQWKTASGYHRRSLAETLMYRLKTLTGHSLWAREIGSQAAEVAIRAGVLNRMVALARPAIRPYRLSSASPRSPCFQSRIMQQRPLKADHCSRTQCGQSVLSFHRGGAAEAAPCTSTRQFFTAVSSGSCSTSPRRYATATRPGCNSSSANTMLAESAKEGYSSKELADQYGKKESDAVELLNVQAYTEEFRKSRGHPDHWSSVSGKEFAFSKIVSSRQKVTDEGNQEIFKQAVFTPIDGKSTMRTTDPASSIPSAAMLDSPVWDERRRSGIRIEDA